VRNEPGRDAGPPGDDELAAVVMAARQAFAAAADLDALLAVKPAHLGDRSPVRTAKQAIGSLPAGDRPSAGRLVNESLAQIERAFDERMAVLRQERDDRVLREERVDVTLAADLDPMGASHPLMLLQDRMCDVFVALGYDIAEGPVVEAEWYNFDALNIGRDHPARTMLDTFYVDPPGSNLVLRSHTSSVQARAMLARTPPIYVVCPGPVFRTDEVDATHAPMFHQIEGLVVDEGITMAHLRGTLDHFAREMFGDVQTRWRPYYFPFTEPSCEVDLWCFVCRGASVGDPDRPCRTCSSEGWIEWGGCGIVNPRVLVACGIDPERYTGFAFGMGIERTLMFRHGATDMRDMVEGDVRFALPFGLGA
jgi:phenylalanyl-tRNA synthetase alpha chain